MGSAKIVKLIDLANKRLNSSEDFDEFQSFAREELDVKTIYSLIDEKIDHQDGPKVLEYILVGLSVITDAQPIVEKVYEYVLKAINAADITEKMKICLISRLSLELNKLSTGQLIKFINMCKNDIESSNENSIHIWKEIMPQILKIISEEKSLKIESLELSGADYKEMIIKDICHFKVESDIIVPLALMFRRTQLSEKEHELVILMLCSYFEHLKPQEVPSLLQQILPFCSSGDFLYLFCTLRKYFDDKYIINKSINDQNRFEIGADVNDMMEAESTVLFLLEDFAKVHASFVSDVTKYIKSCIGAPNMVFGPFMLAFLLTMSCCGPYEVLVITLIKKLVIQSLEEDENIKRSCWLKINYTNIYDVFEQFQIFIKSEISSYEKVFKGLVNLGLSFLGTTSSVFKKNVEIVNKIHQLGLFIIVALVNKRSFITSSVLRSLTNFIASNPTCCQYLECLHKLCKNQKANIVENNAELLRLFKEIPVGLTDKVTYAVMPVLKVSTYLRDNVIMILRKELMSKDFQLRHSAVSGFIEILCSVRLNDITAFSQSTNNTQDSWPGLFTQMVLDRNSVDIYSSNNCGLEDSSDNNKAICLEILDILKTCFFQKAEIKRTLYRGLIKVTCHNEELCVCVTSLLLDHLSSWCIKVQNKRSLKFDKAITVGKDGKLLIHEPLDELIILAQHLLMKNTSFENNDAHINSETLNNLLNQLVEFYCDCNTDEIKVNDNDSLLDIISNIAEYADIIKQVLCVYQSLIAYIINSWIRQDQDKEYSEKLQKLFSKYNHILDAIKACDKTNKKKDNKGNKKIKSETTTDSKSQKFIEPIIHLDFDVLYKFLSLLSTNTSWSSQQTVTLLKQNGKLWEFVLKLVLNHVFEMKQLLSQDIKPRNLYENLCKLTRLLYNYFLFDLREKIRLNQCTVELGIECYLQIITLVNFYYKKLNTFFKDSNKDDTVDSSEDQSELFNVLRNIRSHLDTVLEVNQLDSSINGDNEEDANDSLDKIESYLIKCIAIICHAIDSNNQKVKNILVWLSTIIEKYSFSNTPNAKDFLTLTIELHSAYQEDPIMLADIIKYLCNSFGRINKSQKTNESQMKFLRIITEYNKTTLCSVLCQCLCNELNHVLTCLSRIKAELCASLKNIKSVCQDRIKAREKAVCHRIILVILAANTFTKTNIPLGQCTESVFILLHQVFKTVNIVIKHFHMRSSFHEPIYKQALLEKLSQIINELFAPNVSKFIMYVEHDRPLTEKEKKSNQLKQQTKRQASYIPKVVTELELFINLITKLGKKCKDKNLINIKLTSSRDFRLNIQKAQEVLSKQDNSEESEEETDEINQNISHHPDNSEQPPQKKRKSTTNTSMSIGSPVY
ncbi:Fanconi anemia group I protein-like isoform X2 [Daktulosphaira vitifoliae]|uniref:Fanconi anemia group I protein-like isoform X2 n=1 Tax=Daktulosphaira vitifoliae TaxID=58002 RepID=UPI0021AA73EC|nr:Fanconi anemia group I protein-like isoform X2 [Daktulosphaira vitifoliae]